MDEFIMSVKRKEHSRKVRKKGRTRVREHWMNITKNRTPSIHKLSSRRIIMEESDKNNPSILIGRENLKHTSEENAEARIAHFEKTTKEQRKRDYLSNEPIAKDLQQYINNPKKYDWKGVDTAIPQNFEIHLTVIPTWNPELLTARFDLVDTLLKIRVGATDFDIKLDKKEIDVDMMAIAKPYRGLQLSSHLRRQLTLLADEYGYTISTEASGAGNKFSNEKLAQYYASFGKKGHNYKNRPPHK